MIPHSEKNKLSSGQNFHAMKHYSVLSSLLFISCITYLYGQFQESKLEKLKNVRYFAFTKKDPNKLFGIRDADCSDRNLTTVFIVHGFFKISLKEPLTTKDDIFHSEPDVGCVIVVSWLDYSTYSGNKLFLLKLFSH